MANNPSLYGAEGKTIGKQLQEVRLIGQLVGSGQARDAEIIYIKAQTPIAPAGLGGSNVQTAPVTKAQRFDLEGGGK